MAQKIGQMKFSGVRVPTGVRIAQSKNPLLHGYGYKLKQQLLRAGKLG